MRLGTYPGKHLEAADEGKLQVQEDQKRKWIGIPIRISAPASEIIDRLLAIGNNFERMLDFSFSKGSLQGDNVVFEILYGENRIG